MNSKMLANQLNKVKNFSESSSKSQNHDIDSNSATEFLNCILNEEQNFNNKVILVLNSDSGILHVAAHICKASFLISMISELPNTTLKHNLLSFNVNCDLILSSIPVFNKKYVDIAIIGPNLEKSKLTDLVLIKKASEMARTVYCAFQEKHMKKFSENFNNFSTIGKIYIKMPGSSGYHQQNAELIEHSIIKIVNF